MTPEKELMSAMAAANYPLEQENVAVKANTPGAKVGFGAVAGSVGATAVGSSAPVRPRPNIADITPNNIGDDLVDPNELNVCDSCQ
jgi:hypothetical protein